jgi:hypothetical protein
MSKNDITRDTLRTRGPSKEYDEGYARIFGTKTPQAECAPREAQPVGPRTTLNYDGTFDTTCAHCGGNGCFACLKSAAPTPERADAEKDAALPDWRIADGWHNTFSTSNPYCPCDLKSFTKAVRWAERAILATNKK